MTAEQYNDAVETYKAAIQRVTDGWLALVDASGLGSLEDAVVKGPQPITAYAEEILAAARDADAHLDAIQTLIRQLTP